MEVRFDGPSSIKTCQNCAEKLSPWGLTEVAYSRIKIRHEKFSLSIDGTNATYSTNYYDQRTQHMPPFGRKRMDDFFFCSVFGKKLPSVNVT
ncbi:hypothetical protein CEXT_91391 [Caerostris extrusa]|uniref:Uncharacterized protein n=1 Tax=Caerostris extrusa TaxID=172846 RepID=A0AAV4QC05_CAEEX|nr:hypothetical protein CEXT_91391 [Caerostris extrusa]